VIRIAMTNVYVDDEEKAHAFSTDVLGFETRTRVDLGGALFVTVGAPGRDVELLLEPGDSDRPPVHEGAAGGGAAVHRLRRGRSRAEYERLRGRGVVFTREPREQGPVLTAVLDDTVGDLIQLAQPAG
jgi:catechol 2,3-dioxygenase-like lactoylglutathione lyase family enzyme